ncbi:MAG: pilus assembly protein [Chloroflexi bacterium]|nr:pilus assembly protein [Chloroflexota bacterium]MDA1240885.1 pilus assembly protein [Chloroflexota bacterium]
MKQHAMPHWQDRVADDRGQAVVEMAFVLAILMTLVIGGIEVGRAVNAWAIVTHASREGARVGAATCTLDPGCEDRVTDAIEISLTGLPVADARWTVDPGPYQAGAPFQVRVEFDVVPFTPLIGAFFSDGALTLVGETTMRLE